MPFMDHFNKIAKTVSEGASNAAKKSSEMVEITKLNLTIQSQQDKIKGIKAELGDKIYEKFVNGAIMDEDVVALCYSIKEIEENIKQINVKIGLLKNSKICSSCGEEITSNSAFCPKCGAKQEEIVDCSEAEDIEVKVEEVVEKEEK